jgi:hypothetical protein
MSAILPEWCENFDRVSSVVHGLRLQFLEGIILLYNFFKHNTYYIVKNSIPAMVITLHSS